MKLLLFPKGKSSMKNILVPIDFSGNSLNALEYALRFFGKSQCNFHLLHVNTKGTSVNTEDVFGHQESMVSVVPANTTKEKFKQTLQWIKESMPANEKHTFFTIVDNNSIINSIRKQVVEKKIDIIVTGTKGTSGINSSAIGSTAENIITKVKCTAMVVPERAKYIEPKQIVFPTDFSISYNRKTLLPLMQIAKDNKAALRVLYIIRQNEKLNQDQQNNKGYLEDCFKDSSCSFHFLVNKHLESALEEFVDKENINLVAMLAKNLNYFQKVLFRPAIKELNYYKKTPFLVLH